MKTFKTIFFLFLLAINSPARTNMPVVEPDPSTGLPIGTNFVSVVKIKTNALDKITAEADLVFKGRVVSSSAETNSSFPSWGNPHTTKFTVISILKGNVNSNELIFWHCTSGPMAWGGGTEPSHYQFEEAQTYLVFAKHLDKPDYLFSVPPDANSRSNEFRQLYSGGIFRTLDERPLVNLSVSNALWLELNLLLNSGVATNSFYAIQHLNMMSKSCLASWGHDDDFEREAVLKAILPFVTNANDRVAISAIGCFQLGGNTGTFVTDQGGWMPILRGSSEVQPECVAQVSPYAASLIDVANKSSSIPRRIAAIAALSCTGFPIVSNSLPQWLGDADERVRAQAVLLLPDFPGEFSEQLLREQATDSSPKVRSMVANAIGNGKLDRLLPTLVTLFSEPVGPTNPIPPLTLDELQSGAQSFDENVGDVHTSAGYALLKFDVNLVGKILKTNLNDVGFKPNFLCKLAENNAEPWLTNLVEMLEARRDRIWKEAETNNVEPKADYIQARITLSGTYYTSWHIIYDYLHELPSSEFAGGNLNRCLDILENAGTANSDQPVKIYELYRM